MIRGMKFVGIPVSDQDRALAFYCESLGFKVVTDQPFDDKQRWIELRIPGADTGVTLFTPPGHESRVGTFHAISFWTDDVAGTVAELQARGVTFDGGVQRAPWGTFAIFTDLDGNRFVLGSR
jgi:catechol 2,3-dioxygenase-like lactoylglutathione lyase family enzyme